MYAMCVAGGAHAIGICDGGEHQAGLALRLDWIGALERRGQKINFDHLFSQRFSSHSLAIHPPKSFPSSRLLTHRQAIPRKPPLHAISTFP